MPKPEKPRFTWPPSGDDFKKRMHKEIAAPAAILQTLGADIVIAPEDSKTLRAWLASQDSGIDELIQGGARSWNHTHLVAVARGLVFGDWGDFARLLAMQSGMTPGEGAAKDLEGEEPRSTDYTPFRVAAYLIAAARHPKPEARQNAVEVLRRIVAMDALGAVSWTDQGPDLRNARGDLWHHGATLSPVGERSPKTSNPDYLGLFQRLTTGKGGNDREGFCGVVADIVGWPTIGNPDVATCLAWLAGASVFGEFHFVEYPEGRLAWRPKQLNPLTPSSLWSFADHRTQRQVRGFPFDPSEKNRGKGSPRSLGCGIENGEIVARSTDDRWTARFRLPTSRPIWSVIVDGNGARFEGEPPRPPVTPPIDPPPVTPPAGPDIESLVADVEALGAQPDPTNQAVALLRGRDWRGASAVVAGMMVPKKRIGARDALAAKLGRGGR